MGQTIDQYLNIRSAVEPSPSPDGREIAFLTDITGYNQVWVVSAKSGWPRRVTFTDDVVRQVAWSPTGEWLAFAMDARGDERHQLYLVRPDGSEQRQLTNDPATAHHFGAWSADGKQISFSSNGRDKRWFDAYVVDLESGESRCVLQHDSANYARRFSPDGSRLIVRRANGSLDDDLFTVQLRHDAVTHVTPHDGRVRFGDPVWSPNGTSLLVTTDLETDFASLRRLDLADLSWTDLAHEPWDIESVAVASDGVTTVYAVNEDGASIVRRRPGDTRLEGLPQAVIGALQFSRDDSLLVMQVSGPAHTSDIWACDPPSGEVWQVTFSDLAGVSRETLAVPDLVHYPTFDGRQIPAWLYLPQGERPSRGWPAVIWIHGGPEGQTRASFSPVMQYLVHRGYAVLAPNVRGSTGYGKSWHRLDDRDQRPDSVRDAALAVDYLAASGEVDPQRIAPVGGSYGGFMVLSLVADYPDLWAAGVDIFGIANFETYFAHTEPYRVRHRASEYGDPVEDVELLRSLSPIHRVGNIRCPMLILQGERDPRVPQIESDQMVEALRGRGIPVRYIKFPDEGHGLTRQPNRVTAYGAIAEFLDEHLGGGSGR